MTGLGEAGAARHKWVRPCASIPAPPPALRTPTLHRPQPGVPPFWGSPQRRRRHGGGTAALALLALRGVAAAAAAAPNLGTRNIAPSIIRTAIMAAPRKSGRSAAGRRRPARAGRSPRRARCKGRGTKTLLTHVQSIIAGRVTARVKTAHDARPDALTLCSGGRVFRPPPSTALPHRLHFSHTSPLYSAALLLERGPSVVLAWC